MGANQAPMAGYFLRQDFLSSSGNVILQFPGSIPSTRAWPCESRYPSDSVPSGAVTRYFSFGTGLPALSSSSTSTQWPVFSFAAEPAALDKDSQPGHG